MVVRKHEGVLKQGKKILNGQTGTFYKKITTRRGSRGTSVPDTDSVVMVFSLNSVQEVHGVCLVRSHFRST